MKLAVISTVWFPLSHTDVIVTRWVEPYFTDSVHGWTKPSSTIASLYLEQIPANDMGRQFCAQHDIPIFDSVRSALTLGTDRLAVDGVLLIGEHGDYPLNEFRQKLYPRKRLFDAITAVFRESGRAVPIFNDKHFSWDFSHSCEMFEVASELGFALYGGSSLTHCPLDPGPPLHAGEEAVEALALFHGDPDNYGFHSMEYAQSLVEVRRGGETGIRAVRSFEGHAVRSALAADEMPRDLLQRALVHHGYPDTEDIISFILDRTEGLIAYQLEHRDGLRITHLLVPKFVGEWVVALKTKEGEVRSCHLLGGDGRDFFSNFARLNARVEEFFQSGTAPTPPLRTHLVTGALQAALQALKQGGAWVQTPQLTVAY
ncbi:hypothetical protein BH09VER1_BH09VER1_07980 [soil metagenome]